MNVRADKDVDARYEALRGKYGSSRPEANGYRLKSFFQREQKLLLSALDRTKGPFLDVACGSGLMLQPLLKEGCQVFGIDFNAEACKGAAGNGISIVRGDAFNLPFPDHTIGQIVNCQFLNQQTSAQAKKFIEECARVLRPGGQVIILWRHAHSLIHRTSHAVFTFFDKFSGKPEFPQYEHPVNELKAFAGQAGLAVEKEAVTLPFLWPETVGVQGVAAACIGASLFIVLRKP